MRMPVAAAALILFAVSTASAAATKAEVKQAPAPAAPAPAVAAPKWDVIADKSTIAFHGKQMGNDFDGVITKFTPEIYFDENHLDQSKVTADIDINSIDAKDAERNKNLKDTDWFDADHFPTARFETTKFVRTGDDAFTADGNLTIHGITVPIELPFKLEHEKSGNTVIMTGHVTLDRSKFQLGTGDWADPTVIANEVPVDITITAAPEASRGAAKAEGKPANP